MTPRCAAAVALVAALLAAWTALCGAPRAAAQDLGADVVEITLREGRTLVDPGTAVADGLAAWAADGQGPGELQASAVRADARGVVRLPFRAEGGTIVAWAPGRAPVAVRAGAPVPLDLDLSRALSCDVAVTSAAGVAVAGAEVAGDSLVLVLRATGDASPVHRMRVATRTAIDGRARLEGLPDAPLTVRARADGHVEASAFPVDPARGVTLVLGRGSRVSGTLRLDPGGIAPPEGTVAKLGDRVAPVAKDGAWAFDTVPPGPVALTFAGRGFVAPEPRTFVLADGTDRADVAVAAARTSSLAGRVLLPKGRTVPGVRLVFAYRPGSAATTAALIVPVAADGAYRAAELAPGDGVAVTVEARGFTPKRVAGLSLPSGGDAQPLEVRLDPGAPVAGVVVGLDEAPVAAAVVALYADEAGRVETVRTRTDADGRFAADGVPPGRTWVRVLGRPAGGSMDFGPFDVPEGTDPAAGPPPVDVGTLRAFSGWTLHGRVTDADGRTLPPGIAVAASQDGAEVARAGPAPDGRFALTGLRAGPVAVRAALGEETVGAASASLPAAGELSIVCGLPAVVSGSILDVNGAPVAAASLRATPVGAAVEGGARAVAVRDPSGRFELRLPRGRWRLEADDGQGATGIRELLVPLDAQGAVVLTIERGVTVMGTVSAFRSATPVEGSAVRAVVVGDRAASGVARVDAGGRFVLRGVPPGPVRLRIETPDGQVHETGPRAAAPMDVLDFGVIEIAPGTRLRGEVTGPGGVALARGHVRIVCDGGTVRDAGVDEWGRFVATGLPPGGAVLELRDQSGALLRTERIRVPWSWDDWTLRVDLAQGTRVVGTVSTGGRPEPFARLVLRLDWPDGFVVAGTADALGRYALPPSRAGRGELEVMVAGAETGFRQRVRVEESVEQVLDVELPEASVTGLVESADGGPPVAWVPVELRIPGFVEPIARARSGEDGRFVLQRVPPGTYDLVATAPVSGPVWIPGVVVRRGVDTADISVQLRPEARFTLRAVDDRGRPVSTAYAVAWLPEGDRAARVGPVLDARADGNGVVRLRGLSRGAWRIVVGAPGFAETALGVVRVGEGDQDVGDVWLATGGLLRVTAFGYGRPRGLAGVAIEVRNAYDVDPRPSRTGRHVLRGDDPQFVTDATGVAEIPNLGAGTYRVWPALRPDAEIRVRVRAGQVADAWLHVPEGPPPE